MPVGPLFQVLSISARYETFAREYEDTIEGHAQAIERTLAVLREKFSDRSPIFIERSMGVISEAMHGNLSPMMDFPESLDVAYFLCLPQFEEWFLEYSITDQRRLPSVTTPELVERLRCRFHELNSVDDAIKYGSIGSIGILDDSYGAFQTGEPILPHEMHDITGTTLDFAALSECFRSVEKAGVFNLGEYSDPYITIILRSYYEPACAFKVALLCGRDAIAVSYMPDVSRLSNRSAVWAHVYLHDAPQTIKHALRFTYGEFHSFCVATFARLRKEDFEFTSQLLADYVECAADTAPHKVSEDGMNPIMNKDMAKVLTELYIAAICYERTNLARSMIQVISRDCSKYCKDVAWLTPKCLVPSKSAVGLGQYGPKAIALMRLLCTVYA